MATGIKVTPKLVEQVREQYPIEALQLDSFVNQHGGDMSNIPTSKLKKQDPDLVRRLRHIVAEVEGASVREVSPNRAISYLGHDRNKRDWMESEEIEKHFRQVIPLETAREVMDGATIEPVKRLMAQTGLTPVYNIATNRKPIQQWIDGLYPELSGKGSLYDAILGRMDAAQLREPFEELAFQNIDVLSRGRLRKAGKTGKKILKALQADATLKPLEILVEAGFSPNHFREDDGFDEEALDLRIARHATADIGEMLAESLFLRVADIDPYLERFGELKGFIPTPLTAISVDPGSWKNGEKVRDNPQVELERIDPFSTGRKKRYADGRIFNGTRSAAYEVKTFREVHSGLINSWTNRWDGVRWLDGKGIDGKLLIILSPLDDSLESTVSEQESKGWRILSGEEFVGLYRRAYQELPDAQPMIDIADYAINQQHILQTKSCREAREWARGYMKSAASNLRNGQPPPGIPGSADSVSEPSMDVDEDAIYIMYSASSDNRETSFLTAISMVYSDGESAITETLTARNPLDEQRLIQRLAQRSQGKRVYTWDPSPSEEVPDYLAYRNRANRVQPLSGENLHRSGMPQDPRDEFTRRSEAHDGIALYRQHLRGDDQALRTLSKVVSDAAESLPILHKEYRGIPF